MIQKTSASLTLAAFLAVPVVASDYRHLPDHVEICIGCHGAEGNVVYDGTPVIGGKDEAYLYQMLSNMQQGWIEVELMASFIEALDEAQLREAVKYFSQRPVMEPEEDLYCAGCHESTTNHARWDVEEPHG